MLLTLFRLTMIVPLLINAVGVETNPEKLSFVPSEENKAVARSHRQGSTFLKEKSVRDEDSRLVEKRQSNKNSRYSSDQDSIVRRGSVSFTKNRIPRQGGGGLAHKMAKDALKSPKMQETIRKLSRVSPKGTLRGSIKMPTVSKTGSKVAEGKRHRKVLRHKGQRKKKKRKRHHRKLRKQQPGLLKRGSSKRTLDTERGINALTKKSNGRGNSMIKHNPVILGGRSRDELSTESDVEVNAMKVDDSDYVDFSSPLSTTQKSRKIESEKMIDRLMRTTTKDPSKKNPGDQGIEYSDYYSDDEVLQDIAANKIPIELAESKNLNDRFARQAMNFTSRRSNRIKHLKPYYPDYDTRERDDLGHKDDGVDYLNNFQNYPTNERFSRLNRNSRLFGADDDPFLSYETNYGSSERQNENFDAPYSANTAEIPQHSRVAENNNFDSNESNDQVQQPVVETQNPDQFNYWNQYETPEENLRNLNLHESQTVNVNEPVEPQIQSLNNYQRIETNLPQEGNFEQSMTNQPLIDNTRIPGAKGENTEIATPFNYSPPRLYSNQENQQQDEQVALQNFPVQSRYNVPTVNVPNAMDQPLGKVLEFLGINIDGGNRKENPSFDGNINRQILPYSNTYENAIPEEHFISPSYLKKKPGREQTNFREDDNTRGLERQAIRYRGRSKAEEGSFMGQSNRNGIYIGNDILARLNDDRDPGHNTNTSTAAHNTKELASEILSTIMDELEELKEDRSKNNKREGLPCRLSGSWSTAQAGMKLDMRVVNRTIIVKLSDLASPRLHDSLLNGTWNVSGHAPFKRGSPFTLIATNNCTNSIAVFVGACRVCQGIDTIAGVWSVARQPKGCKDFQVSTSVFNDIFRKTKLSSLKEKQDANSTENATMKHKKRKS